MDNYTRTYDTDYECDEKECALPVVSSETRDSHSFIIDHFFSRAYTV